MTLLRSIICLFALLAQAWPAQAMPRTAEPEACAMECCAAMSLCECAEPSAPAEPANAPAVSGRKWAPQAVWVPVEEAGPLPRSPRALNEGASRWAESSFENQPQVRLAVLFCSFLN